MAAHHVLWFAWGNAEGRVPRDDITLTFAGRRDRAYLAALDRLRRRAILQGEDFAIALPGTREERTGGSHAYLTGNEDPL